MFQFSLIHHPISARHDWHLQFFTSPEAAIAMWLEKRKKREGSVQKVTMLLSERSLVTKSSNPADEQSK